MKTVVRKTLDSMTDTQIRKVMRDAVMDGEAKVHGQTITKTDIENWLKT